MKIFGAAYIIAMIISVCNGGKVRAEVKKPAVWVQPVCCVEQTEPVRETEPVPEYIAPEWEYVQWADYEGGQDGGEIYLG